MWEELPEDKKEKYKTLITNFASLSEAFSQKSDDSNDEITYVSPIVNSKFQEKAFQVAFNAVNEDIANTSYDVSVKLENGKKFLVGIKSFGINAKDQKIAQFKSASSSPDWFDLLKQISDNAKNCSEKSKLDRLNEKIYFELANKIANLRNKRIETSKELIKGFLNENSEVSSVYHVLMTSPKNVLPKIFVGEIEYLSIDTNNIKILGSTTKSNPSNFKFTDGKHYYKYTSSDSQLYMDFNNENIIREDWNVEYIKNPFSVFENLHTLIKNEYEILDSVSWVISDQNNEIEKYSGFNAFNGTSKLAKANRKSRIDKIKNSFCTLDSIDEIISYLQVILLKEWKQSEKDLAERDKLRRGLMELVKNQENDELYKKVSKLVYRSANEVYIPIPDSKQFHLQRPDFFGKDIGKLDAKKCKRLLLPKEKRVFNLKFLPSGDTIKAYINQDSGKAIQSKDNQDILGGWLLKKVFQLKERELLTAEKLNDLEINAIRLTKYADSVGYIGIEFFWIDVNNPPSDIIGWVKNMRNK